MVGSARFFHKEHHFNAQVHVGIVLRDFATGAPTGTLPKIRILTHWSLRCIVFSQGHHQENAG